MQKKRVLSVILALTLSIGCAIPAQASSISETQKKGEELQSQKDSAEAEKAALTKQLNDLIDEMDKTTEDINTKQEEIDAKETELIQAQIDENNQYESMKKRIKYMYENGNTQFIEVLLESKSIGEFLNNEEYIAQIEENIKTMGSSGRYLCWYVPTKPDCKLDAAEAIYVTGRKLMCGEA